MKHDINDYKDALSACLNSMQNYKLSLNKFNVLGWEKQFDKNLIDARALFKDDAKIDNEVIFELVKNTPVKLKDDENHCPLCFSKNVEELSHRSTLVGSMSDVDPNHHWVDCRCKDCNRNYTREYKESNVWYTASDGQFVLLGVPSCFESYVYTCKHCGGLVKRLYKELDGLTLHTKSWNSYNNGKPLQRAFYKCKKCKNEIEYPQEYWHDYSEETK